jgi:hypothetical protein
MKKTQYDHEPPQLQAVGNGSYLYRWDITAIQVEHNETPATMYECFEVLVWDEPNATKVIEAAIAAKWNPSYEAKLINDYNAAKEGLLSEEYKTAYIDFISERNALKDEIRGFFNNR